MRALLLLVFVLTIVARSPANAQNLRSKCLGATNAGDATINCHKASFLLQNQQLEVLLQIRDALINRSNRSLSQIAARAARLNNTLSSIAKVIEPWSAGPSNFFIVRNPQDITESRFKCSDGLNCGDEANALAGSICKRLGFDRPLSHEYDRSELSKGNSRITWVLCQH